MTSEFKLTEKQKEAQTMLAGVATNNMLFGGSRSGKTFLHIRNTVMRAMKAPESRHAILRMRFNHIKSAIIYDTFPKVMKIAFPNSNYQLNKTDFFAAFDNGSEIWFGGLDDKERTEKILGNEYVTLFLNECSQISWEARNMVLTRLAQKVEEKVGGRPPRTMKPRMYYDCNPPNKLHWTYKVFRQGINPDDRMPLPNPNDFACLQMNPVDNLENLSEGYMATLDSLGARMRARFRDGEFADANPNQLFTDLMFELGRKDKGDELPDFVRIVVAVDPSGSGDIDNAHNDAIGIIVAALGTDGDAYILEDCTVKAGPATWGNVATTAYDRHMADLIVGEKNFGGAMVQHTIQTARPGTPYKDVSASRGKHVRAEPISALYEKGRVHHVGQFSELEEELTGFSTAGYIGDSSPNRADALVWVLTELFPGIVKEHTSFTKIRFAGWGQ